MDFTEKAPATNAFTNLTANGNYQTVGQSGWTYASQYVTEFDNIAFARLRTDNKTYGFALRTNGTNKGLYCQGQSHTMTLVGMKQNYIITVKTSANAITEQYKGNYGADASIQTSDNNTTYTYKMLGDGDLNLLVAKDAYVKSITVEKPDETAVELKYTVNAVCEGSTISQLSTGIMQQNMSYSVSGIPFAIMNNGKCYKLNDADVKNYSKTFTMGETDATETVSYSKATDINYFFEAENILSRKYGDEEGNYSSGKTACVYTGATLTMSSITSGIYTVTVNSSVRRANEDILNVQVSTDNIDWTDAGSITLTSNIGGDYSAENIILPADGYIRLVEGKKQNMCHYIDYIILKKTAETITLNTATDYTNSTFCSDYDLDFSGVNDVEVYKAAIQGDKVVTTKIEGGKVKAGTGIIIKNVNHVASVTVPVTSDATELTGNDLVGVTADMTNNDFAGKNAYILVSDTQFQKVDAVQEGTIQKGKAYLEAKTAGAKPAMLFIGDATTGIESVESQTKGDDAIYTIQGIRVKDTNAKGIYIINGKKYKF